MDHGICSPTLLPPQLGWERESKWKGEINGLREEQFNKTIIIINIYLMSDTQWNCSHQLVTDAQPW